MFRAKTIWIIKKENMIKCYSFCIRNKFLLLKTLHSITQMTTQTISPLLKNEG